jgi:hypothetical protein
LICKLSDLRNWFSDADPAKKFGSISNPRARNHLAMPRKTPTNLRSKQLVQSNATAMSAVATITDADTTSKAGVCNESSTIPSKTSSTTLMSMMPKLATKPSTTPRLFATPLTVFTNSSLPGLTTTKPTTAGVTLQSEHATKRVLSFTSSMVEETNIELGSDSLACSFSNNEKSTFDLRVCKAPRLSSQSSVKTAPTPPPLDLSRAGEIVDRMMLENTCDEIHARALGWDLAMVGLKAAKAQPKMRFAVSLLQDNVRCSEAKQRCDQVHVFCALCSKLICDCGSQATTTYMDNTTYYSAKVSQLTMRKQNKSIWAPHPCDDCESVIAGQPLCQCAMELGSVPTQADKEVFANEVWQSRGTLVLKQ